MMTKYKIEKTNRFKKDFKKVKLWNSFDETIFKKVVLMLANGELLPEKYRNHLLEPKSERNMGVSYKTKYTFILY